MVHQRLEPRYAFVVKSWQHDHQAASGAQFFCPQRKESFPVLGSLPLEQGAVGACTAEWSEMSRNRSWNAAQPHRCIRTPPQMDRIRRENTFIERPSDRTGKYVWFVQRISVRVRVQHFEERVEVV